MPEDFKRREGDRKHYRSRGHQFFVYVCSMKMLKLGYWVRWIIDINFTCSSTSYFRLILVTRGTRTCRVRQPPQDAKEVLGTEWIRILLENSGGSSWWLNGESLQGRRDKVVPLGLFREHCCVWLSSFSLCHKSSLTPKDVLLNHSSCVSFCLLEWILGGMM